MLIKASWVEALQHTLGIDGVSQVWGDRPAWYFWIRNAAGVYCLEAHRTEAREFNGMRLHSALFSLKCYPYALSRWFRFFSFEERCFVKSRFFDPSNTPFHEHREKVGDHLFCIAVIEYTTEAESPFAVFTLESLDTLRMHYPEETTRHYPVLNRSRRFESGEVDRRIPGVAIAYPFYDCLLCLNSFHSREKPSRVTILRSPGFQHMWGRGHTVSCVDAPEIEAVTIRTQYGRPSVDGPDDAPGTTENRLGEEKGDLVFDRVFSCGHPHRKRHESTRWVALNRRWWTLADADYGSHLATLCGCS